MIICPIENKKPELETRIVVGLKSYLECMKINIGTTSTKQFPSWLIFCLKGCANIAFDDTPHTYAKNTDKLIESLKESWIVFLSGLKTIFSKAIPISVT